MKLFDDWQKWRKRLNEYKRGLHDGVIIVFVCMLLGTLVVL